jgi:hypothetical protein
MINGEFYVREGHALTYSEEDLAKEGQVLLKKLLSFHEKNTAAQPSPAPILQFSAQQIKEDKSTADDMLIDEGFKIIRKGRTELSPQVKGSNSHETKNDLPKNIRRIFGDDEE